MAKRSGFIGTFPKSDVGNLAVELDRQKKARRDFIFPASALAMTAAGGLIFKSMDTFQVGETVYTSFADAEAAAEAVKAAGGEYTPIVPLGKSGDMPVSDTAESQLASRLDIPIKYIRKLRANSHGDLAATNFSTLLERDKRRFLVRTLDSNVRAVLSNGYRCLDNGDLFFTSVEAFKAVGAELWTARLWENGFQVFGVSPGLTDRVTTDRPFDAGQGWTSKWEGTDGDVHNAAVSIHNSETGRGGLDVEPALYRRACKNGLVWGDTYGRIHIGGRNKVDGLLQHLGLGEPGDGAEFFSEETLKSKDRVIWMEIRDVIKGAFDPERFAAYIAKLNGATTLEITKPEKAVENVAAEFELSDERRAQILAELLGSGDRSKYGLIQAVTYSAHAADSEARPDEAAALEEIGADILDMSDVAFNTLTERNAPSRRKSKDAELATV